MPIPLARRRRRRGFTLVELLVALLLFDCALLALAGDAGVLARASNVARRRETAASAALATIQRLKALGCPAPTVASRSVAPGISETWTVAQGPASIRWVRDSVVYLAWAAPASFVLTSAVVC
jgi:Tfp pilus assembly protein PilV